MEAKDAVGAGRGGGAECGVNALVLRLWLCKRSVCMAEIQLLRCR